MADPIPATIESLTAQLIEAEGRATDLEGLLATTKLDLEQATSDISKLKAEADANAKGFQAKVSELENKLKNGVGRELAEVKAKLQAAELKAESFVKKLASKLALPGTHIAVNTIKHDGVTYQPGEVYKGSNTDAMLKAGAIKVQE